MKLAEGYVKRLLTWCTYEQRPLLSYEEIGELLESWLVLHAARKLTAEQAEDEGLWCHAEHIAEDQLQRALRKLTAVIEGEIEK